MESTTLDALGNPIKVGNFYGYSFSKNGKLTTVVGIANNTYIPSDVKITLGNCRQKSGVYGQPNTPFIAQERPRTVYASHCFPVTL